MEIKKKAVYFTIDAIVALTIVLTVLIIAYPLVTYQNSVNKLQYDTISTVSNLKIGDFDNAQVKSWIAAGVINDTQKPISEQIAEFYFTDINKAKLLASIILANVPASKNVGIWFDGTLLASKNITAYNENTNRNIDLANQKISGIRGDSENVSGYSARAFLSSSSQTKYYFFGGYIGDGDITAPINYIGNAESVTIEASVDSSNSTTGTATTKFDLFVNNHFLGSFAKSTNEFTPVKYTLATTNLTYFISGSNNLTFKAQNGEKLRIGGGYVKVSYNTSALYEIENRKYFPGIKGVINIYDGFYVPNTLSSLKAYLHFNSSEPLNFTIGNTTVFNLLGSSEQKISINDTYLRTKLNYNSLVNKTTPYRLFIKGSNTTYIGNADVILITDLSETMNRSIGDNNVQGIRRTCTDPQLYSPTTARLSLAQCLDKEFVDQILNVSGNRISIVAVMADPTSPNKPVVNITNGFTTNAVYAKTLIDHYDDLLYYDGNPFSPPAGGGSICAGLNTAYRLFSENSNKTTRSQFVVSMSDGLPMYRCTTGNNNFMGTQTGLPDDKINPITASCSTGQGAVDEASGSQCTAADINSNPCKLSILNANWSSCRLKGKISGYSATNATVYSIGFGPVDSCQWANTTLNYIAQCGDGEYFTSSNSSQLQTIYQRIAETIVRVSYTQQISESLNVSTELYPDSYIEFEFIKEPVPFGLVLNIEKLFTNSTFGSFSNPPNSQILETRVITYSGPRWTSLVSANKIIAYNLSTYGNKSEFTSLGDPYSINVPTSFLTSASTVQNNITLSTGNETAVNYPGSMSNKIIYTIIKNISSYNTTVSAFSRGCIWTIQFEDNTLKTLNIPPTYSGSDTCKYTNSSGIIFSSNDAQQQAAYELLSILDFDGNKKLDADITQENLGIEASPISGIPFSYNLNLEVRTWS